MKKQKIMFKKIVLIFLVFLSLGSLLIVFNFREENLRSFKPYYAQAYWKAWNYKFGLYYQDLMKGSVVSSKNFAKTKTVPVLLYHGILSKTDGKNVDLSTFEDQMFTLKKAGYQTVSLDDFYQFLKGERDLPEKSFVLTFDDGRKDSVYPVNPILEALGYKAVMFVITANSLIDKTSFHVSTSELDQMNKSGLWDIEIHTKNGHHDYPIDSNSSGHFYTNRLWINNRLETMVEYILRVKKDLSEAKSDLSNKLGVKADSFAFPYGDYGQNSNTGLKDVFLSLAQSNFEHGFYQVNPGDGYLANYQGDNDFMIKRIDVTPQTSAQELLKIFESSEAKSLPYIDNFESNNGWTEVWGKFAVQDHSLVIQSDQTADGGSGFLDGASLWQNYTFQTLVDWRDGDNLILLARYQNDNNYVACNFYSQGAQIQQKINGLDQVLNTIDKNLKTQSNQLSLGMKIEKDKLQCLYNNEAILESNFDQQKLKKGGIGFKSWSTDVVKPVKIIIHQVKVEEL